MDFEWTLRGGSKQATRSGKNKLNFKNIDSTLAQSVTYSIKEGIITLDGTASGLLNIYSETFEVTETGQYTLSKNTGGIFDIGTGTSTPSILIQQKQTDGSFSTVQGTELSGKSTSNSITFKLEKGTYRLRIFTAVGNSLNNFSWKPQLENGTEATSYEEYGVSPSPDFPSEIKNVGKSYNLAYTDWAEEFVNIVNDQSKAKIKEENGITFLHYLASTGYHNYDEIHFFPQIEYKENTTYSFEFDLRAEVKYVENICIEYTDGSSERLGMTNGANIWTHFRFSSNPNKTVKYLRPKYNDGSTDINVNTIQIIESPLFKPYNPYNQKQINIEVNNDNSFDIDKIHRGYYDESRYLKDSLSTNSCGQLFEIKHDTIIRIKNISDSSWKACCFVYDENMNKLESIWWGDTLKSGIESSKKINYKNNMKYVSFSIMDITGIYNPGIFRQSAEVGIYDGRVYSLDNLPKYQEHKGMEITFPLAEGQKLYEGSYLAEDGIHNIRRQDILTGEESLQKYHSDTSNGFVGFWLAMSKKHKKNADFLCTHLTKNGDNVYYNRGLGGWLPDEDRGCYICVPISILKDVSTAEKQIESMKEYLTEQYNAGTPMKFEYELATEEIIPYIQEQQTVIDKILYTYKNVTNISVDDELASIDVTYKKDLETMFNNIIKQMSNNTSETTEI